MLTPQSPVNPQMIQQLKTIMNQIQASKNPQLALQNMLMQNPNLNLINNLLHLNNGNLQQTAQFIAQQRNIDLNSLIQELQSH